jgi:hypothetical protein
LSFAGPSIILGPISDTVVVSHNVEGASYQELGWHINSFLLHPFTTPAKISRFASSVVTRQSYKIGGQTYTHPTSSRSISHHLPASLPTAKKKERLRNKSKNRRGLLRLQGDASPSFLNHGRIGLDHVRSHERAPTKSHESGIYDSGEAHNLLHARRSFIPHSCRGIRRGMCGNL